MWQWFSTFFEKALVRRVYRFMLIRIVRLCCSTYEVVGASLRGSLLTVY